MARFEEEVVDRWYVIRGYLTARNITYKSPVRRPGGRGRGEIDLLAVKLGDEGVEDCVRVEVSVSVTSKFPFTSVKHPHIDEVRKLVKRFFSRGAHEKAVEYFGSREYRNQLVVGEFAKNWREKIERRLPPNAKLIDARPTELGTEVKIEYEPDDPGIEVGGVREIEIVRFNTVLEDLRRIFEQKGLTERDFADPFMRSIQHILKLRSEL